MRARAHTHTPPPPPPQPHNSGFALWDVVGSCEKIGGKSSADARIDHANAIPNDIRGQVLEHYPSIERICFSAGSVADVFLRHNRPWVKTSGTFHRCVFRAWGRGRGRQTIHDYACSRARAYTYTHARARVNA